MKTWKPLALALIVALLTAWLDLTASPGRQLPLANADAAVTELPLADFESKDETWDFLIGSTYALGSGEYSLDTSVHHSGAASGKLQLDFNQYYWVTLERYLFKRVLPTDARELSFWVKTADMTAFDLILLDNGNQNHQQTVRLQPTTDWQKVTISSFVSGIGYTHWGGKNDGVWSGPLKKISFKLSKPQLKVGRTTGTIWFDDLRAQVDTPELTIAQTQVGNVFAGTRTAAFDVLTTGDTIGWTAFNAWNEPVASGSSPVAGGRLRLAVTVPEDGYYRLKADSYKGGIKTRTAETTFAALPSFDLTAVADSPFGMQTHYGIGWNRESIPLVKYAGAKHARDSFYWSEIELAKGTYTFNPKHTLPMQGFQEHGIEPFLTFAFSNQFYDNFQTPYTDDARTGYANYVKAQLAKYGSQVKAGEMWNEFDLPYFGGKGPAASRADMYFELLKKGYEAAKAVRPDLNVVGGATSGIPRAWLGDVFALGGLNYMDTLSVHPYRYPNSPEGLTNEIAQLNDLVRAYNNGQTIPIWFSELGWPTHLSPQGVDENTQAAYLIRSYVVSIASGVEKLFWYDMMDDGTDKQNNEHNFGIVHNPGDALGAYTPKPAYVAYATMARQLTGATLTGQSTADGIYRYTFEKDGQHVQAMWSPAKQDVTLRTTGSVTVTDMMGRIAEYAPAEGEVVLTLNGEPLFVRGQVQSVIPGARFTLQSPSAYTGDPITVTLVANDPAQTSVTAHVYFQGASANIAINGPGSYPVTFPAVGQAGTHASFARITGSGQPIAGLSERFQVAKAEQMTVKHVKKEGEDALEVRVENAKPTERRLAGADWKVGGVSFTQTYGIAIPAHSVKTLYLPLAGLPERTPLDYAVAVAWEDGAITRADGSVRIIASADMKPLSFHTSQEMTSLPDSEGIDLVTDVRSRITGYNGPNDLSGKLWFGYDTVNLYVYARVRDDVFSQPYAGDAMWQGDSIQFAVSAGTPGEAVQWYEYGMALTPQGPELYRWMAPSGMTTGTVTNRQLQVTRDETAKLTMYRLALPWTELKPIAPTDGMLSLSVVVNENDGTSRKGYVEWGSGIGSGKQSSLFNPMLLQWFDGVSLQAPVAALTRGISAEATVRGTMRGLPVNLAAAQVSLVSSEPDTLEATVTNTVYGSVYGTVTGKKNGTASLKAVVRHNGWTAESAPVEFRVNEAPE
ncbi:hypothetical protein ACFFNY_25810 [Paenibacillus hodogayensis]|uniref:Carbohydrate-binding domain-containing protein n=1 Tax=Paenibacillus hodogayensis TaxID=279208 RepID=A0ABV5W388_9BACL